MIDVASDLYENMLVWHETYGEAESLELFHKLWDATPWVVECYVGGYARAMQKWCEERWGPHARWLREDTESPGTWRRWAADASGWEWFGFDTEAKLEEFKAAWYGGRRNDK